MTQTVFNQTTEKRAATAVTARSQAPAACIITYSDFGANTRGRKQAEALMSAGFTVDCIIPRSLSDSRTWGLPPELNLEFMPIYKKRSKKQAMYAVRYFLFFVLTLLAVTRLHFKRRYTYIQVATLPEFMVFTALIPRLLGVKVVLDVCDLSSELYESKFRREATHPIARLVRLVEKMSLLFASELITVHEPYRQKLLERGIPDRKMTILLNVADETIFKPQPAPADEGAAGAKAFRLVYHGTVARRNGVDLIIRALGEVKRTAPELPVVLDVYGDGDAYNEVLELIKELEVGNMVRLHRGFAPVAQLPTLLAGADAGLVANRYDGFMEYTLPTKLLEYVALGVPSIVARTVAIESYFDRTQLAFFEPEDYRELAGQIVELARNKARLSELSRQAYRFYDVHNWHNTRQRYLEMVGRLTGAKMTEA